MSAEKPDTDVTVRLFLSGEQVDALELLGGGSAARALAELAGRATDGVFRPGSWERGWVLRAFPPAFLDQLEQDPGMPWRRRRRKAPDGEVPR